MTDCNESIQVALRIRPLVTREKERGCQTIVEQVVKEPQVFVRDTDKCFTFNYVFGPDDSQHYVYDTSVKNLIDKLFKGFNVTILAYGQTGSGKTYSMGTSYDGGEDVGIIPRSVSDIFRRAEELQTEAVYKITASFVELYQEQLFDLLAPNRCVVDIREDGKGIKIPGLTEVEVRSPNDMLSCLMQGSNGRATGATAMNAQSSRSHAIFTINIEQTKRNDVDDCVCAKFHLVDLAGSERPKKTQAVGDRFKEGVNINRGLLALGNVISALGEGSQTHIPYRDSKLTRLLQDSLGGNSVTLMIACVSPADYNMLETLNTLRYADRAKQIKNKPIVNRDPKTAEIMRLKEQVNQLQMKLQCGGITDDTSVVDYKKREKELQEENMGLLVKLRKVTEQMTEMINQNVDLQEKLELAEEGRCRLEVKLHELREEYDMTITMLNQTVQENQAICPAEFIERLKSLHNIQRRIQDLQEEHRQSGKELLRHEISRVSVMPSSPGCEGDAEVDDEKREHHTMQQAKLNEELQEITKQLAFKEELVSKLVENANEYTKVKNDYEENKRQIEFLKKEKDTLTQTVTALPSNGDGSKMHDIHRKRIQELEQKINELNKKIVSQAKVIKLQQTSEDKIGKLQTEILGMKNAKVRLIRQMKLESEKFKHWKIERERELCKLKDQDRKRQNQIMKMERQHEKRQNVLRRKVEEVVAVNKRLKDALALQKSTQEKRYNKENQSQRIQQMIERELEVVASTMMAEKTLEDLIEDRAVLTSRLASLRETVDPTPEIVDEIEQVNTEIDFRSSQITDLQQKIADFDQESKSRTRWDFIQSIVDAKCSLKALFVLTTELKRESTRTSDIEEAKKNLEVLLEEKENELQETILRHQQILDAAEQEHQNKVFVLLKQLTGSERNSDTALRERIEILEAELEKFDELKRLYELTKQQLNQMKEEQNKENKRKNRSRSRTMSETVQSSIIEEDEFVESFVDDDPSKDPDWWSSSHVKQERGLKRSSDGSTKCTCKAECRTKRCGCKKNGSSCNEECKCSKGTCTNRKSAQYFDQSSESDKVTPPPVQSEKRTRIAFASLENTMAQPEPEHEYKTPLRRGTLYFAPEHGVPELKLPEF